MDPVSESRVPPVRRPQGLGWKHPWMGWEQALAI